MPPAPPIKTKVEMRILEEAMAAYSSRLSKKETRNLHRKVLVQGPVYTGAQTNSGGMELLGELSFPKSKLFNTSNSIKGAAYKTSWWSWRTT